MDGSVLMDREEKLKDWPNKKDSDIAAEIFNLHGFTPEVEDTEVIHDEAVSTVIQRETDIQFLNRLALRNGFECYVEGTTGVLPPTAGGRATPAGARRPLRRRDQRQPLRDRGQCADAGQCVDVPGGPDQ